jgi:hypothetical protein
MLIYESRIKVKLTQDTQKYIIYEEYKITFKDAYEFTCKKYSNQLKF